MSNNVSKECLYLLHKIAMDNYIDNYIVNVIIITSKIFTK